MVAQDKAQVKDRPCPTCGKVDDHPVTHTCEKSYKFMHRPCGQWLTSRELWSHNCPAEDEEGRLL